MYGIEIMSIWLSKEWVDFFKLALCLEIEIFCLYIIKILGGNIKTNRKTLNLWISHYHTSINVEIFAGIVGGKEDTPSKYLKLIKYLSIFKHELTYVTSRERYQDKSLSSFSNWFDDVKIASVESKT